MKSRNTKPEVLIRKSLTELGLNYRLHRRDLPGTPDIVFSKSKLAVFVHGCYWHRHAGCELAKTNRQTSLEWIERFNGIVKKDTIVKEKFSQMNWRVYVAWECQILKNPLREGQNIARILESKASV
jgi:DNA mismatch endonuclease (patch repair protein)